MPAMRAQFTRIDKNGHWQNLIYLLASNQQPRRHGDDSRWRKGEEEGASHDAPHNPLNRAYVIEDGMFSAENTFGHQIWHFSFRLLYQSSSQLHLFHYLTIVLKDLICAF